MLPAQDNITVINKYIKSSGGPDLITHVDYGTPSLSKSDLCDMACVEVDAI